MQYIVNFSEGEYNNYRVSDTMLLGSVDPTPLMDAFVKRMSAGLFDTLDKMQKESQGTFWDLKLGYPHRASEGDKLRNDTMIEKIRDCLAGHLLVNGFVECQATEVWLG